MTNIEMIQKLTLGTSNIETVKIDYQGEETEFKLRPLTSGELSQLQVIEKKPFVVKVGMQNGKRESTNVNDININTGEFTEAQNEAMYHAIALSLSVEEETITPEEIKTMPAGIPELLFEKVILVSKLSDDELTVIKQFRKD